LSPPIILLLLHGTNKRDQNGGHTTYSLVNGFFTAGNLLAVTEKALNVDGLRESQLRADVSQLENAESDFAG
jgi:hypothetical protein